MRLKLSAVLTAAVLGWPVLAVADTPPIRPGLWLTKMQLDGADAAKMREMEERMKSMPPEQRQMMENMMKQHGISASNPGEVKLCMTKETLDADAWHAQRERETGCKTQTTRNGNVWKFHSSCPAPSASETDGEATFLSDTKYTLKSTTTSADGGQKKTRTMSGTSTWLGADCGDIKPAVPKRK